MARNKAFRKNATTWAESRPAPRLAILRQTMQPMANLMRRSLMLASAQWAERQELKVARGEARSFRVLEAANQNDLREYFSGMSALLLQPPKAIPFSQLTVSLRLRMLRVVSRSMCSMHQLLRRARRGLPYQLFQSLVTLQYLGCIVAICYQCKL